MWTWEFWSDTLERAVYTFAEAMLGYMTVGGFSDIDWKHALSVSGVAFIATIFKCILTYGMSEAKLKAK